MSSDQRHPITFRLRLCSWDVFPYDLLPDQLRPIGLLLGQVSNGEAFRLRYISFPRRSGGSAERSEAIGAFVQQPQQETYGFVR